MVLSLHDLAKSTLGEALTALSPKTCMNHYYVGVDTSRLFDEQVDLRDEGTREEIRQLVEAVAHWCRRVQPEEPVSTQSEAGP